MRLTFPRIVFLALACRVSPLAEEAPEDGAPAGRDGREASAATFAADVLPFVSRYCTDCHDGETRKGGLALDVFTDEASVLKERKVWGNVLRKLRARAMPPRRRRQPSPEEVAQVTAWIQERVFHVDCTGSVDPGRVTVRRLNRTEYDNTIRDLVGVDFKVSADFPADDVGYGFDNIGDVLSLPPLLFERYLAAAERVVEEALENPGSRRMLLMCRLTGDAKWSCARKIVAHFARRAFRRPLRVNELEKLLRLVKLCVKEGGSFEEGIAIALQAVLVSPHFLFRVEEDPEATDPGEAYPISEYELASRLSYFIWSTMPDEILFDLAERGVLRENLDDQVWRMLEDPKSRALVANFAGQWLQIRRLEAAAPDPERFVDFDDELRVAMRKETELFFEAILRENRSVLQFLDADFTFLNERLARHYGISGVKGDHFRKVSVAGTPRGGVLTQASVLTVTSNPTRTSPVKRGKWVLEQILGAPLPPPPPGVVELQDDEAARLSGSLRQRMEQHRSKPECASCHSQMDPLGFGLENFDAIGAWRERDGNFPINPSGSLPSGESFTGPQDLKLILKKRKDAFCRTLVEKMLTYALGRGLEYYDKCAVDTVLKAMEEDENRLSTMILAIVNSPPFLMRRAE